MQEGSVISFSSYENARTNITLDSNTYDFAIIAGNDATLPDDIDVIDVGLLLGEYGNLQCIWDGAENFPSAGVRNGQEIYRLDQPDTVLEPVYDGMTPFEYGWSPKPVECDCEFGTGQMSNYCPSGKDLCDTCVSGYHLNDANSCVMTPVECECEFGTGQMSTSCPEGQDLCDTCDNGYHMNGIFILYIMNWRICKLNRCTCQNGDGATGVQCPTHHEALCSSNCDIGYTNVDGLCELEKNDSVSDFSSNYFINYEEMMRFSTSDAYKWFDSRNFEFPRQKKFVSTQYIRYLWHIVC